MARSKELYTAFVGNLSCNVTRAHLLEVFEPYDSFHSVYIRVPEPSAGRTFGFVRFTSLESRDAAVEAQNGRLLLGQYMSVEKSRHTPLRSAYPVEGVQVDACKKNVRDRVDEIEDASIYRPEAMDALSQMNCLQQVKDSYAKTLACKYGVHGEAADNMVADFIEHLNRIPYGIVGMADLATSPTARLDVGLVRAQLPKLKQQQHPDGAGFAAMRSELVPDVAESKQPPPLWPTIPTFSTASQEQLASCQQLQLPPAVVAPSAADVSTGRDGVDQPPEGSGPRCSGGSVASAAPLPTLRPALPARIGVLGGSSTSLEPRGRGKASLEFLEECTGRRRLHAKNI